MLASHDAAFVDFGEPKNGFLQIKDVIVPGMSATTRRRKKITDLLQNGQDILVQIEKNPMKTKGARVTMELSIAGRFLVLTPGGEGSGVSKRLPDGERERLRKLVKQLETEDVGVIARTAAAGATIEDLERDLRFLRKIWAQVEARAKAAPTKTIVYQDGDLSLRVIRDLLNRNVDKVIVDTERQYRRILGWVRTTQPEFTDRIELLHGLDAPVRALRRRDGHPLHAQQPRRPALRRLPDLRLRRGVHRDRRQLRPVPARQNGLEDTITRNNIEAAREVMRQLRLRDIGGIIVIDFIDMAVAKNRAEVLKVLQEELEQRPHQDLPGRDLAARPGRDDPPERHRRVRETLTRICPTCGGEGRVLSERDDGGRGRAAAAQAGALVGLGGLPRPHQREGRGAARRPRRRQAARARARDREALHGRAGERLPLTEVDVVRRGHRGPSRR